MCEKKRILRRFDALGVGYFLAEMQGLTSTVPELSKPTKVSCRDVPFELLRVLVLPTIFHWRRPASSRVSPCLCCVLTSLAH